MLSWCSSLKPSKRVSQLAGTFIEFTYVEHMGGGGVGRGRICCCIVVQLNSMRFLFSDSFVAACVRVKWFSLVNSAANAKCCLHGAVYKVKKNDLKLNAAAAA